MPTPDPITSNKYGGYCYVCKRWVEPLAGVVHRFGRKWTQMHRGCAEARRQEIEAERRRQK